MTNSTRKPEHVGCSAQEINEIESEKSFWIDGWAHHSKLLIASLEKGSANKDKHEACRSSGCANASEK